MSISISAKCYQENKERVQNKDGKRYQNLSKEEKKSSNMFLNITKVSLKMKTKPC